GAVAVAVVVSDRQGDGVGADVGAVKVGLAQAQAGDAAGVGAAVVDLGRSDCALAAVIRLNGQVGAEGRRRDQIAHRDSGRAGGGVAVVVGHRQDDGVGPDVGAIKIGLAQAQVGDAGGVGAAVVDQGRRHGSLAADVQ